MPKVSAALESARIALAARGSAQLDAEVLLAHILGIERAALLSRLDEELPPETSETYQKMVAQRASGMPVAYLVGHKEFYGRDFLVTPDVLVPRPESELLIDLALPEITAGDTVFDIGTGSGCLGLTISLERPQVAVQLIDLSENALLVARHNAAELGARQVSFQLADLWPEQVSAKPEQSVVIANLPYVPEADYDANPDLQHEPAQALKAGVDGLEYIDRLLGTFKQRQFLPRLLLLEIDPSQVEPIKKMAWGTVSVHQDLAGHDRVVAIRN